MRAFAEWEEQEYLLIALPHEKTDWNAYLDEILSAYYEFVCAVAKFQKVILIAPKNAKNSIFANIKNVSLAFIDTNDTWVRDFGVICAQNDDKSVLYYDFNFNAWGGKFQSNLDNAVNKELFRISALKGELKSVDLILEGGSVEFNGNGTLLTTSKCLLNQNRGSRDKNQLEIKLKELFGLKNIIWLENGEILGDDTDCHIDTLARFIDENTIVYSSCDDKNDENFASLNAMKNELEKTEFNLIPLPIPNKIFYNGHRLGATYANFIFINNALIVPTYNDKKADDIVLNTLSKYVKRQIIPVKADVFLRQNGSLHCSSQNIFKGKNL